MKTISGSMSAITASQSPRLTASTLSWNLATFCDMPSAVCRSRPLVSLAVGGPQPGRLERLLLASERLHPHDPPLPEGPDLGPPAVERHAAAPAPAALDRKSTRLNSS